MTTIINFKTDKKVKDEAQKIAGQMGLNLSDILNVYLRRFVKEKELHISLDRPSEGLVKEIKEAEAEIKRGDVSPSFGNAKDAVAWLSDKKRKYAD